jgi:nitrogen fixation protein NifM
MIAKSNPDIEPYTLLRASLALFEKPPAELNEQQFQQLSRQARNEFAIETRVLNSTEAAGVMVTEVLVEAAFAEVRQRFESDEVFRVALETNQLDETKLKQALSRQCKVEMVLELVASRAPQVSEVEIGIFYHSHPEKFFCPEQRMARHILVSINPQFPENTREKAQEKIEQIAELLKRKPHKFPEQALKNSECPTAFNGGELGALVPGKLFPELDAALFSLKENKISSVVETEMGFHLIQCLKIIPAETMSLKKATPKIKKLMQERYRHNCQRSWLASLPVC